MTTSEPQGERGLLAEPNVDRTSLAPQTKQLPQQHQQQQATGGLITVDELASALRITTGEPVTSPVREILERLLLAAEEQVNDYAPGANKYSRGEAIIRLVGFLYDERFTALNNAPQVDALSAVWKYVVVEPVPQHHRSDRMKIFGWHLDHGEHRAINFTSVITDALLASASTPQVNTGALSVVEACVGLISDPFWVATTSGPPLPARMLYQAAWDLLRYGNSVWAVETGTGALVLRRPARWAVEGGSLDPDSWVYPLEFSAPNGDTIKRRLPAVSVVHMRLGSDPGADWIGKAPWPIGLISSRRPGALARIASRCPQAWIATHFLPAAPNGLRTENKHNLQASRTAAELEPPHNAPGRSPWGDPGWYR